MAAALFIEQPADGAAGRVVDAVQRPRTDGEIGGGLQGQGQGRCQPGQGSAKPDGQKVQDALEHSEPDHWLIKRMGQPHPGWHRAVARKRAAGAVLGGPWRPGMAGVGRRQNIPYCVRIRIGSDRLYCGVGRRRPAGAQRRARMAFSMRASASTRRARVQPKLSRTNWPSPNWAPGESPTPACSKKAMGSSSPNALTSIQAR